MDDSTSDSNWYQLEGPSVLAALKVPSEGLSEPEVRSRRERAGPNELPHEPPATIWEIGLRQFKSPLIYILGLAAIISLGVGEFTDAGFIGAVLALNALIGGYQEWKAEKSSLALQKLLRATAVVERDGQVREIPAEELVPGDLIWLESGQRVPADARLLSTFGLEVDESLLTGESEPVHKDATWTTSEATPPADQRNMAFAGSTVTRGRAKAVVVATGGETSVGQLALDVQASRGGEPPLLVRMRRFTRVIATTVGVAAAGIGAAGLFVQGFPLTEMVLFAVAIAVSAIPEGLPVAMTVALSIATTRMARRGVIVRRLTAVEGLGSCTFIATDKTGTLTRNELMVREISLPNDESFEVTGEGFIPSGTIEKDGRAIGEEERARLEPLVRASVLCNEGTLHERNGTWSWRGDTVDLALLVLGHKLGVDPELELDRYPQVNQIPYEPERQFAATYHRVDEHIEVYAKGAPERIIEMCDLDSETASRLESQADRFAARGYRVLAVAAGSGPNDLTSEAVPEEPGGLEFLGVLAMMDPLRSGVQEAVQSAREAGIEVTMVTGDHRITAEAIARDLDLITDSSQVVTGRELEEMPRDQYPELIARTRVFARVTPRQKLEIVQAAREQGHFVAVTGDGVNDAPALKQANIGVAMGKSGTDVAREASEIVLSDDNFSTIIAGVEEGRIAYGNIRNVIYLLISTGAAELLMIMLSVLAGMPLPLLPVQLLWLNLVTNGIQDVALAFERGEEDVLKRRPRPARERIFNRLMVERTLLGAITIGGIAFAAFLTMLEAGWSEVEARNGLLLLVVLFQNVHVGNSRSETRSLFRLSPARNPLLAAGVLTAFGLHVLSMHLPFMQSVLSVQPVSLETGAIFLALALVVLPVMELHKWWWRRRTRNE